jgi:hypothetical protein
LKRKGAVATTDAHPNVAAPTLFVAATVVCHITAAASDAISTKTNTTPG